MQQQNGHQADAPSQPATVRTSRLIPDADLIEMRDLLKASEKLIIQLRNDVEANEAEKAEQAEALAVLRSENESLRTALRLLNTKLAKVETAFRSIRAELRSFLNLRRYGPLIWAWNALRKRSLTAEYLAEQQYHRKTAKAKAALRTSYL